MGCADWAPNQRQIIIVHSHSQTHLSAVCRQEAIRRCRARQGKATAQPLCGAGEERNCQWPFRQRARRRAEERNSLSSEKHSCFRLPPAYKKRDPKRSLSFVELEKKGTACGRSASERGDEPRSGTLSTSPPAFLASDSIQPTKKETPKGLFRLWSWRESNPRPNK